MKKIYGIYPGNIRNVDKIDSLSEINLFFKIDSYIDYIIKLKDTTNDDMSEELYALEYLIYQTKKYGVLFSEPRENEYLIPSESFIRWYSYYKEYFNNNFTNEEYRNLKFARINNDDVSSYLPKINWLDTKNNRVEIKIKIKQL